jgi:hypothetical protein
LDAALDAAREADLAADAAAEAPRAAALFIDLFAERCAERDLPRERDLLRCLRDLAIIYNTIRKKIIFKILKIFKLILNNLLNKNIYA